MSRYANNFMLLLQGFAGAREMINDGCLGSTMGPEVDAIYGIHLWSYADLGEVGCTNGEAFSFFPLLYLKSLI